jgi:hypothetical protein
VIFTGPADSPYATAPLYPMPGSCAAGSAVTFADGVATGANAASITLFDTGGGVLNVQDVPTGASGFAGLTVSPGAPKSFLLGATPTQVAGTAFPVGLTTLDSYGNVDTNYSGTQCVAFSGASDAPDGTGPSYGTSDPCSQGPQLPSPTVSRRAPTSLRSRFSTRNRSHWMPRTPPIAWGRSI